MDRFVYKIATRSQWADATSAGQFDGAPVDLADGFIHFSTASQTAETAAKHFAGMDDLVLAEIDGELLGEALKYEVSRGGQLFPHLYARLPVGDAVIWEEIQLQADGSHRFPDWFEEDESRSA